MLNGLDNFISAASTTHLFLSSSFPQNNQVGEDALNREIGWHARNDRGRNVFEQDSDNACYKDKDTACPLHTVKLNIGTVLSSGSSTDPLLVTDPYWENWVITLYILFFVLCMNISHNDCHNVLVPLHCFHCSSHCKQCESKTVPPGRSKENWWLEYGGWLKKASFPV